MAFILDAGFNGEARSMANVVGRNGQGLRIYQANPQPTTTAVIVLSPSPNRKWALIQNVGSVDCYFSADEAFTDLGTVGFKLTPDGNLLFNDEMPWTGALYAKTLAGTASLALWSATVGLT